MRLTHLGYIIQRKEAAELQRSLLQFGFLLLFIVGAVASCITKNPLPLLNIGGPVVIVVYWLLDIDRQLKALKALYSSSLNEGFESVPDFAQLESFTVVEKTPLGDETRPVTPPRISGVYYFILAGSALVTMVSLGIAATH